MALTAPARPLDAADPRGSGAPGAPARPGLVRGRRGVLTAASGVLVVVLGALVGLGVHATTTSTRPVLVLARDVARGEVLTAADLRVVAVNAGGVNAVEADRLGDVVGTTALHRLAAGSMLAEGSTGRPTITNGRVTIGLLLPPGRVPSTGLSPGSPVTVHRVTGEKGAVRGRGASVPARVVAVTPAAEGESRTALDLEVERDRAAELAGWSAAGEVAVVGEAG